MLPNRLRHLMSAVVITAMGCSGVNLLGPENQLQLVNEAGTFEWQATALDGVTQTLSYSWTNGGTVANVNQSSSLTTGSGTLQVNDASGASVYTGGLDQNGTFQTTSGASGTWTVVVTMDDVSGAVNFRLETP